MAQSDSICRSPREGKYSQIELTIFMILKSFLVSEDVPSAREAESD